MGNADVAVVTLNSAEHYQWGDGCDGWYFLKRDDLHVISERMPPLKQEARHKHARSRQLFFVLEGVLTLEIDEQTYDLGPYCALEVAPGVPHQVLNKGQSDVRFLVISHPPSHGDRIDA